MQTYDESMQLLWKSVIALDSVLDSTIEEFSKMRALRADIAKAFGDGSTEVLGTQPGNGYGFLYFEQMRKIKGIQRDFREVEGKIKSFRNVYAITAIYDQLKPKYDGLMWVLGLE